ncbi:Wzz/FepE/Etk N-terminal domain-containing protein [Pseudomonas aeruginosa]|uniref:Wzz/FepE/Etk N-terminal domain-containing protein n=1 Tax=Pseudomonas aeruginosa TaxID=287 RepID=UPI001F1F69DA|nr:Wzz/FepE/Etk N-terminal domain-containing protein [Pseudomonas aeruginosa]
MTADGEVDLVKLVKELWVNKVLILLTTLLALIGSFTYAYLSKPVYEYRVAVNVINLRNFSYKYHIISAKFSA